MLATSSSTITINLLNILSSISLIYKKKFKELVRWGCPTQGQFPRGTHLRLRPRDRVPWILATRWSLVRCSYWFRWTNLGCYSWPALLQHLDLFRIAEPAGLRQLHRSILA